MVFRTPTIGIHAILLHSNCCSPHMCLIFTHVSQSLVFLNFISLALWSPHYTVYYSYMRYLWLNLSSASSCTSPRHSVLSIALTSGRRLQWIHSLIVHVIYYCYHNNDQTSNALALTVSHLFQSMVTTVNWSILLFQSQWSQRSSFSVSTNCSR